MLDTCANRPELAVSQQTQAGPTPVPSSDLGPPTPGTKTYASCDATQAASETRVQSHKCGGCPASSILAAHCLNKNVTYRK